MIACRSASAGRQGISTRSATRAADAQGRLRSHSTRTGTGTRRIFAKPRSNSRFMVRRRRAFRMRRRSPLPHSNQRYRVTR